MSVVILGGSTTPSSTRTDVHTTVTAVTHTATETTITAAPPLHGAKAQANRTPFSGTDTPLRLYWEHQQQRGTRGSDDKATLHANLYIG